MCFAQHSGWPRTPASTSDGHGSLSSSPAGRRGHLRRQAAGGDDAAYRLPLPPITTHFRPGKELESSCTCDADDHDALTGYEYTIVRVEH